MKPLDNILVLDLSRVLSGPFCTMSLADMGARVIKIEQPETGDDTRGFGPPFINSESTYFMSVNRNKESLTLNLKHAKAKTILWKLVEKADVLVENFRPGVLDRLGFSFKNCIDKNPSLVYCSISGFGHAGLKLFSQKPGYDLVLQGMGGIQSLTGPKNGIPYKVGPSIADLVSGMLATQGILLALIARGRTNKGQQVDISMLDGQVSLLTYLSGIYFATGNVPQRSGNQHLSIMPYETYLASDGYLNLAIGNDALWKSFCIATDLLDLISADEYKTNANRVKNRAALNLIIEPLIFKETVANWVLKFEQVGIPCGPVLDIGQVLNHPQVIARDMVVSLNHPTAGDIKLTGVPVKLSDTPGAICSPPPLLGEHNSNILLELGISSDELSSLKKEGVI